ncbi:MAG: hypothetical protein FWC16_05135 [Defluviitaleaceae bacterium]|nr:hypothetical protein [Defluviitaleaceae bacterium]MCL2274291.1 hypothetical protein [Defluviitaleaceae bacterium]
MDFITKYIFDKIISGSFSGIYNYIKSKRIGIKLIHETAKNSDKNLVQALSTAKNFYMISYVGDAFIQRHTEEFIKALKNNITMKLLIGKKNSEYLSEASQMYNYKNEHIDGKIDSLTDALAALKLSTKDSKGTIELRHYNTEMRNPMFICENDKVTTAWVSVFLPPKQSANCLMIEFEKKRNEDNVHVDDCLAYFNKIWEMHGNDIYPIE